MDYCVRELERGFLKMNGFFKAILVTGARRVGKTTMLKHLAEGTDRTYVSLDNSLARELVKKYLVLDKASVTRGNGGIICMCEEPIPIDTDNCFIPSNLI